MPLTVHIYVSHLLGSGHLVRMEVLADALAARGHRVTLISGGMPTAAQQSSPPRDYRQIQLPPVRVAADNFSELLTADGVVADTEFLRRRTAELMRVADADAPQVCIVETFPFGRRVLRDEFNALLASVRARRPRPLRLCSVRDILQTRSAARQRETVQAMRENFDGVLVHSDAKVANLTETFPLAGQLRGEVFHSNYLHRDRTDPASAGLRDEVCVSAGGGAVGFHLLQTAIDAQKILAAAARERGNSSATTELAAMPWRILVGRNESRARFAELQRRAGDALTVEWSRADFAARLQRCAVSISQAGYNTVLDATAANCPAVFVPFAQYGETEQRQRAEKWVAMRRAVLVDEARLDAARLAAAAARAATLDISACRPIRMNGADNSVAFIEKHYQRRPTNSV